MNIREANSTDFQAICDLITTAEELFLVYPRGEYPFTVEQVETLAHVRSDLTVVEDNTKIVGFANLHDVTPGKYAFIGNVVVAKESRGKGIGKRIIAHMIELIFTKYELDEARLAVVSRNTPALILYSRLNFKPYDIEERLDYQGDRAALVHMKLTRSEYLNIQNW